MFGSDTSFGERAPEAAGAHSDARSSDTAHALSKMFSAAHLADSPATAGLVEATADDGTLAPDPRVSNKSAAVERNTSALGFRVSMGAGEGPRGAGVLGCVGALLDYLQIAVFGEVDPVGEPCCRVTYIDSPEGR